MSTFGGNHVLQGFQAKGAHEGGAVGRRPGSELDVTLTERRAQLADLLPSTIRPERLVQSIKVAV